MEIKHLSTRSYVLVWILLVVLTLASFLLSRAHLGAADTVVALVIATGKTAFVLLFFMHLVEQRAAVSLVLVVVSFLLAIFVSLMVADVSTRMTFPRGPVPVATPR